MSVLRIKSGRNPGEPLMQGSGCGAGYRDRRCYAACTEHLIWFQLSYVGQKPYVLSLRLTQPQAKFGADGTVLATSDFSESFLRPHQASTRSSHPWKRCSSRSLRLRL